MLKLLSLFVDNIRSHKLFVFDCLLNVLLSLLFFLSSLLLHCSLQCGRTALEFTGTLVLEEATIKERILLLAVFYQELALINLIQVRVDVETLELGLFPLFLPLFLLLESLFFALLSGFLSSLGLFNTLLAFFFPSLLVLFPLSFGFSTLKDTVFKALEELYVPDLDLLSFICEQFLIEVLTILILDRAKLLDLCFKSIPVGIYLLHSLRCCLASLLSLFLGLFDLVNLFLKNFGTILKGAKILALFVLGVFLLIDKLTEFLVLNEIFLALLDLIHLLNEFTFLFGIGRGGLQALLDLLNALFEQIKLIVGLVDELLILSEFALCINDLLVESLHFVIDALSYTGIGI